jgi:hypothetical protein
MQAALLGREFVEREVRHTGHVGSNEARCARIDAKRTGGLSIQLRSFPRKRESRAACAERLALDPRLRGDKRGFYSRSMISAIALI